MNHTMLSTEHPFKQYPATASFVIVCSMVPFCHQGVRSSVNLLGMSAFLTVFDAYWKHSSAMEFVTIVLCCLH